MDAQRDDGQTTRTLNAAHGSEVDALQAQLNKQEADNLELATENRRCRALLEGDDRMADLAQEAGRIEQAMDERQAECDALRAQSVEAEEAAAALREAAEAAEAARAELEAAFDTVEEGRLQVQATMDGVVAEADREREARDGKVTEAQELREETQRMEDEMGAMRASTAAREIALNSWRKAIGACVLPTPPCLQLSRHLLSLVTSSIARDAHRSWAARHPLQVNSSLHAPLFCPSTLAFVHSAPSS